MRRWFLWSVAVLAAAFAVYFLANLPALYARVKLDRSYPALSRYEFERTPDIALVGTSMTFRMFEGYFTLPLRNLAISGRSSLTGLSIVASYPTLPRLILVEVNVMNWGVDPVLVEQFGKNDAEPYKWFRPVRAFISLVYYWIKYQSESENVERLPKLEPTDHDISIPLKEVSEEYSSPKHDRQMELDTETLKQLAQNLENRGSKILLYELPYPAKLGESHYATTVKRLAHAAFPDDKRWLNLKYPEQQLRWLDAVHMDERSAIIMAKEIERAIQGVR